MDKKKRILVIDDEQDIVNMLKLRLIAGGYDVLTSSDGIEGLNIARRDRPDLILLDLMLPRMDGYKICALLKKDTRYANIPIIMFTAKAQEADKQMGSEAGADAYITKPFGYQLLSDKIQELIGKD